MSDYERNQANRDRHGSADTGRSASKSRKVSYTEEETAAQAEGTGSAAEIAAAAAVTREEGRRLDSIIDRGINALVQAVACYEKVTSALLKERQTDAATHRALLDSLRSHFLARAEAEADLVRVRAEAEAGAGGGDNGLEGQAIRALLDGFMAGKGNKSAPIPPIDNSAE